MPPPRSALTGTETSGVFLPFQAKPQKLQASSLRQSVLLNAWKSKKFYKT